MRLRRIWRRREARPRARVLGADEVIHHHKQDVAEEIMPLTNRRGVDIVIEHVGEATWPKSVRSLARGGRLVMRGARFFVAGPLEPAVDRTLPLGGAAAAHRRMEESGQFGKIVLEVP